MGRITPYSEADTLEVLPEEPAFRKMCPGLTSDGRERIHPDGAPHPPRGALSQSVIPAHLTVAVAAKPVAPRMSLGALAAVALLPNLVWRPTPDRLEHMEIDPGNMATAR